MEPLLSTKLYIPSSRPKQISRPRLIRQLNDGLVRTPGVTLISAPAGFGKTTLVSCWLQQTALPAAWLSLDEEDQDFFRFWAYFVAAWQTIEPQVGAHALEMLPSSTVPHSHAFLTQLINDLAGLKEDSILVLDDYHAAQSEALDKSLTFFVDHLPPHVHLVISSRTEPNLPFARLRAGGLLNELRSTDLSFTQSETSQFLEQVPNLHISDTDLASLNERMEGWAAGLQMAVLALEQRDTRHIAKFIESFTGSHRYIMDYLIDEVLQQQPAEVQSFLLYTSILDQFCAPLCEAVLREGELPDDESDASPLSMMLDTHRVKELLEYLERSNLFINSLDDERHWYRYHHLFADLLGHRLSQMYPDRVATLHLRASRWYEKAGLIGQAVRHALAAQDFPGAAKLIEHIALTLIQHSELNRMLTWLPALPKEEIHARPLLALYFGWSLLLSGKVKQAAAHLDDLQRRLEADKAEQTLEVQGHIAALQAYLMRETGDLSTTIALSQQALAYLPEQETLSRLITLNLAIAYYLEGDLDPASRLLTEIITTGQTAHLMANTLSAVYLKTLLLRSQGSLQQAVQLCQEVLEWVTQRGWHGFPAVGFLYVAYGELLRERNQLTTAAEYLEKGIELGQGGGHPHILIIGHVRRAWLQQNLGDSTASQTSIREAVQLMEDHQVSAFWPLPSAAVYQARLWISQNKLAAARRWAQAADLNRSDLPVSFFYETRNLTVSRLLIAQGKIDAAQSLLSRMQEAATSAGRTGSLIEILILQAIAFSAQHREGDALSALQKALGLAEPEGFVRLFLDEGRPMIELLRRAVGQGIHASYAVQLLNTVGDSDDFPRSLGPPLSERELDILRWIAAGYSNQEVAQELVIAVSTVKKHVNNIYGKLGVGNRTSAVARARELGLL